MEITNGIGYNNTIPLFLFNLTIFPTLVFLLMLPLCRLADHHPENRKRILIRKSISANLKHSVTGVKSHVHKEDGSSSLVKKCSTNQNRDVIETKQMQKWAYTMHESSDAKLHYHYHGRNIRTLLIDASQIQPLISQIDQNPFLKLCLPELLVIHDKQRNSLKTQALLSK
ncbi:uncharacterized protein LOC142335325 [Convolutriloba macropyga]|uniref:uncharacterized protein LOC142335325 n=1 Tax=Convolutriloba macropyga TaxID=536237 RepID=UPI003F5287D0